MSPRLYRIHEVETYGGKCYLEQQQNSGGSHPSKKEERIYTLSWTKLDCVTSWNMPWLFWVCM